MKLSAYIRVSQTRPDGRGISPDQQRDAIQRWASAHDVELEGEYVDLDQSGGKMSRPGFDRMMAAVESGVSNGVVVAKIDRFGRSLVGALKALERLEEIGASFVSVADSFDTTTPTGRLLLRIMLSLAEFELERIRDSWDDANARAIAKGVHFTNSVPLGFVRGDDGRLKADPDTAPIVAELFRRRASQASYRELAADLNEGAKRSDGRDWTPRNVATIIQNRAYVGEAFHGKHRNTEAHDAIVTIPEWDAANAVNGGPGAIKQDSALLAGIIRCAGCRYAMRRTWLTRKRANGETRRYETYSCQRNHTGGVCPSPAHVMAETIEPVVVDHFLSWYGVTERQERSADQEAVEAAERVLADADARLETFLADDELRDIVGRERFMEQARQRQDAVDSATTQLEEARALAHVEEARKFVLEDEWQSLSTEGQAAMLRTVIDSIYVRKGHHRKGAPITDRVLIRWAGEDFWELPKRGTTDYKVKPVTWPPEGTLPLANIPQWAIRVSHPHIPEGLLADFHAQAREHDAPWYLPVGQGETEIDPNLT